MIIIVGILIGILGAFIGWKVKGWKGAIIGAFWLVEGVHIAINAIGWMISLDISSTGKIYLIVSYVAINVVQILLITVVFLLVMHFISLPFRKKKEQQEMLQKAKEQMIYYRGLNKIPEDEQELKNLSDLAYVSVFMNCFMVLSRGNYITASVTVKSQILNALPGQEGNLTLLLDAITIIESQKMRQSNYEISGLQSKEDINKAIDTWFESWTSVDIIEKRVLYAIGNIMKDKTKAEKAATLILGLGVKYHKRIEEPFLRMIDNNIKISNKKYDEYVTGETTGLGFGIITTSMAQAALYQAIDIHERNKQISYQQARASRIGKSFSKALVAKIYNPMLGLYAGRYRNELKKAVNLIFDRIGVE